MTMGELAPIDQIANAGDGPCVTLGAPERTPANLKGGALGKTLDNVNVADVKTKVSDVKVFGNGDTFQLLCKASSADQGWMKSCKAMQIDGVGCVVQVTTQQHDQVAEAVTFVPGICIVEDEYGGRKLIAF